MSDDPSSSPSNPTRRVFLKSTSSTAAAAMLGQTVAAHVAEAAELSGAAGKQSASFEIAGAVPITLADQRQLTFTANRSADNALGLHPRNGRANRHEKRLRPWPMRCLHGACEWPPREFLLEPGTAARRQRDHNDRRPGHARRVASHASGVCRLATVISAAIARRAKSCRPSRCSKSPAAPTMRRSRNS